ncbi:MAG: hypothetical protein IJU69_06395 [Bacteroidales bacterium]|nr:hypothetical protein [Bacteroidales bacterium]
MTKKTKTWLIVGGILLAIVIISAVSGGDKKDGSQADTAAAVENTQAAATTPESIVASDATSTEAAVADKSSENEAKVNDGIPVINAAELTAEFDKNEIAAKKKYNGKVYKIKGVIGSFSDGAFDNEIIVNLEGDGFIDTVNCEFSSEYSDKIASLDKGAKVTIQGKIADYVISSVIVKKCKLVE